MLQAYSPYIKNSQNTNRSPKNPGKEQRVQYQQQQPKEGIRQQLPPKVTSKTSVVLPQEMLNSRVSTVINNEIQNNVIPNPQKRCSKL